MPSARGSGVGDTSTEHSEVPPDQRSAGHGPGGGASFLALMNAFNAQDLVSHRIGQGLDPPLEHPMPFWRW
eukprot:7789927-Alexandrium_andersonii.AAC.1